jgi:hypothetical protein
MFIPPLILCAHWVSFFPPAFGVRVVSTRIFVYVSVSWRTEPIFHDLLTDCRYLTTVSTSVLREYVWICTVVVVVYLKVLSRNLCGETEENSEEFQ